jgi:hypothetical protein
MPASPMPLFSPPYHVYPWVQNIGPQNISHHNSSFYHDEAMKTPDSMIKND